MNRIYDENGNAVDDGNLAVAFNQANRSVVFDPTPLSLATIAWQYNASGQRAVEHRLPNTTLEVATFFHYDLDGNLISEKIAHSPTRQYVYLEGQLLAT